VLVRNFSSVQPVLQLPGSNPVVKKKLRDDTSRHWPLTMVIGSPTLGQKSASAGLSVNVGGMNGRTEVDTNTAEVVVVVDVLVVVVVKAVDVIEVVMEVDFVVDVVVEGVLSVTVYLVTPIQEQALEYFTAPEQAEAYAGIEVGDTVT